MTRKKSQFVRGALGGGLVAAFYQFLVAFGLAAKAATALCFGLAIALIAGDQMYRRCRRHNKPPSHSGQ